MSSLAKTYNPKEVEDKWYAYWLEKKFFASKPNPDKEPYTIVIPPPNVTGVLHMGHMLNNTIQDILIRKARMEGKEACWVPGTDHASIATEAKVVQMLKEKGIEKKDISREEFLKYAWEWKEKYGGIILEQLKKLGASCDWDRTRFTMEEALSEQVIKVFVDLYRKGHIYRGARMINWDPQGKTALSDDEVNYKETKSKLYYVKYKVADSEEYLTIATQRPETIMGDTAICVNPNDERYKHLKGKKIIVPLVNREVPVIFDEYVDVAFGTGALKVTPAHDINDYNLGLKHNLEVIDTLNDDGTLSEAAQVFVGTERFKARKLVAKELEAQDLIVKVDEYTTNIGYSERTDAVVEPRISTQWFVEMKKLCEPALENVMNDNIKLHPPKFKNMYRSWMENVRDWCISRQLWWGHRIPAWYLPSGEIIVAKTKAEALQIANSKLPDISGWQLAADRGNIPQEDVPVPFTEKDLQQDEDVLDTWFSSGLWPIAVFDGLLNPDNEDINYYYPTNDLVTAPEILFFWVARMILFGYEYRQEKPYSNVYLTGIVRDKQGRKMSKSLGNSPDPIELMEKYGADGVRTGMLFSSPAGNDLLFDEKLCEQGRNFTNKIWNAFRLVQGWEVIENEEEDASNSIAIKWFEARLNDALIQLEEHYTNYRMSDALMTVYKLVWDDFCSWYLEMIKPEYQGEGKPSLIDKATYEATISFFENVLKIVHPFMPFITEELWHALKERGENECIIVAEYPQPKKQYVAFEKIISEGEIAFDIVRQIREMRNSKGMSPKEEVILYIKTQSKAIYNRFKPIIRKLANLSAISFTSQSMPKSFNFVVKGDEFFIPLKINIAEERARIEKELEYNEGFLESVNKKLSNEKFVQNAKPEIIATEKQKKADAEAKIKALKKALEGLK